MAIKRIPVKKLKLGMYIASLERSWFRTPFFRNKFLLETESQLEKLNRSGIRQVLIDTSRGLDVEASSSAGDGRRTSAPPIAKSSPSRAPETPQELSIEYASAQKARQEMLRSVQTVFQTIGSTETVQNDQVKAVVEDIVIISETLDNPAAFAALSRTRQFDPALSDHAMSVCTLALVVGRSLGYNDQQLHNLAKGAMLHDIGLLRIPHHLMKLSQALTKHEWELYERHPRLGATSLEKTGGFAPEVIRIVAEHHATADGLGFPAETPGESTSESSRIVMVADRYDELVTGQVAVTPLSPFHALSQLFQEAQSNRLDIQLTSHFIKLMGVYPIYTLVALNTGDRAIVTALNPTALHQPVLSLVRDAQGVEYNPAIVVDLAKQNPEEPARSIVATLDPEKEKLNVEEWLARQSESMAVVDAAAPAESES